MQILTALKRAIATLLLSAMTLVPMAFALGAPHTSTTAIDLNNAPISTLVTLPGIGPARARRIILRRERRRFRHVREIMSVRGIGPRTYRRVRRLIYLRAAPSRTRDK